MLAARLAFDRRDLPLGRGAIEDGNGERPGTADRLADEFAGKGDGGGAQIAVGNAVDQAERQRLRRRQRLAGCGEIDRGRHAAKPRRALGAAGAGNDAEIDFGQADTGVGRSNARMRRKREFETTAERSAMDCGDDRLRTSLKGVADLGKEWWFRRPALLLDIGARDKGSSGRGKHDRLHFRIGFGSRQRRRQPGAHRQRRCVDRRVVDLDHRNVAMRDDANDLGNGWSRRAFRHN